jgi:hypothetical protein
VHVCLSPRSPCPRQNAGDGTSYGWTALHYAAHNGWPEGIAELVGRGARLDEPSAGGYLYGRQTPLIVAVKAQQGEAATALLRAGASPNATCQDGWSPLTYAAVNGDAAVTDNLLRAGADPNAFAKASQSALHQAVLKKWGSVVERLVPHCNEATLDDAFAAVVQEAKEESLTMLLRQRVPVGVLMRARAALFHRLSEAAAAQEALQHRISDALDANRGRPLTLEIAALQKEASEAAGLILQLSRMSAVLETSLSRSGGGGAVGGGRRAGGDGTPRLGRTPSTGGSGSSVSGFSGGGGGGGGGSKPGAEGGGSWSVGGLLAGAAAAAAVVGAAALIANAAEDCEGDVDMRDRGGVAAPVAAPAAPRPRRPSSGGARRAGGSGGMDAATVAPPVRPVAPAPAPPAAASPAAASPAAAPPAPADGSNGGGGGVSTECIICMTAPPNAAMVPCGHVTCLDCANTLKRRNGTCPVCRGTIASVLKLHL